MFSIFPSWHKVREIHYHVPQRAKHCITMQTVKDTANPGLNSRGGYMIITQMHDINGLWYDLNLSVHRVEMCTNSHLIVASLPASSAVILHLFDQFDARL